MSGARVRLDISRLQTLDFNRGMLTSEAAREATRRLLTAFEMSPDGAEIIVVVGCIRPTAGIKTEDWIDADQRFKIWFEGDPEVLREWRATTEGSAPWQTLTRAA